VLRFIFIFIFFTSILNCKSQAITSVTVINGSFITTIDTVYFRLTGGFTQLGGVLNKGYSVNGSLITPTVNGCTSGLSTVTNINEIIKINPLPQGTYKIKARLNEFDNFIYPNCDVLKSTRTDSMLINVVTYTALKEQQNYLLDIQIFPNPVKDKVHLQFAEQPIKTNASIFNTLGQSVYMDSELSKSEGIVLDFLSPGLYYLKIQNDYGKKIFKLIKE
jgi:hypothetical protein